jgi:hypothetical protein
LLSGIGRIHDKWPLCGDPRSDTAYQNSFEFWLLKG